MAWKTFLVPHDFSSPAERAFALARELASGPDHKIILLHVSPIPHGLQADTKLVPEEGAAPTRIDDYMTRAAEGALEYRAKGCSARILTLASHRDPAEEILAQAESLGVDVIVIGTHGRKGFRRLLLGSVCERVLRGANVPVVVVRDPGAKEEPHLLEEEAIAAEEAG